MSCRPCLQFLRPPARASSCRDPLYLRFYSVARQIEIQSRRNGRRTSLASSIKVGQRAHLVLGRRSYAKPSADDIDEADMGNRSFIAKRIAKLEEHDALSYPRLVAQQDRMRIPDFVTRYAHNESHDGAPVVLQGRIMSRRSMGNKLVYLDIVGEFQKVQVQLSFGDMNDISIEDFKRCFKPILRGDIVEVTGQATRSATGELTLKASKLPVVLTPGLAPLPRKLEDDETRALNKHVDLLVNRETVDILRIRSKMIRTMRDFFHEKNFLEVQTPIMSDYASGAAARPFLTAANFSIPNKDLALRIAPELWLKRLVVGGMERVFEIGPSFRNEGLDNTHNPEFTTCEFYWAYANLDELITVTEQFIRSMVTSSQTLDLSLPNALNLLDNDTKFQQYPFIPTLERILSITLPSLSSPTAFDEILTLLGDRLPVTIQQERSLNRLLDYLAATYIEPFSSSSPIFITHHPACMSPLSKSFVDPSISQLVSARAELFIQGREIANMYEEENDPAEQRRKFEEQVAARKLSVADADETPAEVDESYVQALEYGLPPTGGWGCGVDRLVMLLSGTQRISDTLTFGSLRNVVSVSGAVKK